MTAVGDGQFATNVFNAFRVMDKKKTGSPNNPDTLYNNPI